MTSLAAPRLLLRPRLFGLLIGGPAALWQALFFVAPIVFLVALSFWVVRNFRMVPAFDTVNWVRMLTRDVFWDAYLRTLSLAAATAVLASVIAFPAAYALAFRASPQLRRFCTLLLITPFFTSYLVRIYAWQVFLLNDGIINAVLGQLGLGPYAMLSTQGATIVGYLTLSLPLVVLIQLLSLSNVDRRLVEAAHNLGCSPWGAVFRIVIPSARAGLCLAALFAFILTFGDFASPLYLGGGETTLSILITDVTKSGQQWPRAAVVAITMILTLLAVAFAVLKFAYARQGSRS